MSLEEVRQRGDVHEPLQTIPAPTMGNNSQNSFPGRFLDPLIKKPIVSSRNMPQCPQAHLYKPGGLWKHVNSLRERLSSNPYEDRADEIGFCHDIEGVGLIGSLLAPPGWTVGSTPFGPEKIKELYDTSRQAAKKHFETAMANSTMMPAQDKERLKATRDEKWKAGLKLDKFVKEERLEIWRTFQNLLSDLTACDNWTKLSLEIPKVMYPPIETSIPYQHDIMRPNLAALFPSRALPAGVSAMQGNQNLEV